MRTSGTPQRLVVEMGSERGGQRVLIEADVDWLDWGEIDLAVVMEEREAIIASGGT